MDNSFAQATAPVVLTGQEEGASFYEYYKGVRGFDPAVKGAWQEQYAEMIDRAFELRGKRVLDLGCAMGALTWAMTERGADVWGVDISPYFIQKSPFEAVRGRLLAGDVTTIVPLFRDGTFDVIHASQVLEHIPAEKQTALLVEMRRVLKMNGLLFAAMPIGEVTVFDPNDDATHVCIKPLDWWQGHMPGLWREGPEGVRQRLTTHPMFQQYGWAHLLWQRWGPI